MAKEKQHPDLKKAFEEVLKVLKETPQPTAEFQEMDLEEVIQKLEEALGTLNTEMDRIYKESGLTKEQMEEYAQNPDNFTKEEWKLLNEVRGELDLFQEEAEAVLGPQPVEVGAGERVVEKPKKKTGKGKKGWKRA